MLSNYVKQFCAHCIETHLIPNSLQIFYCVKACFQRGFESFFQDKFIYKEKCGAVKK